MDVVIMIIFCLFWAVICFLMHFSIDDDGYFLLSGGIFVVYLCILFTLLGG